MTRTQRVVVARFLRRRPAPIQGCLTPLEWLFKSIYEGPVLAL